MGWLFCIRLQKGKRWILNKYLKQFIHKSLKQNYEEEIHYLSKAGEDITVLKKLKDRQKHQEIKLLTKIVNKCIFIPSKCSRRDVHVEKFIKIEEIIRDELGNFMDMEDEISREIWEQTKKQIRNALISLFISFGIFELAISSIIFI